MSENEELTPEEAIELDAAITQIESWSSGCPGACPLGNLLKSVLKILHHCEKQGGGRYRKIK